ncbi:MAG: replication-relaxation family protein [Solirubrobacteraceae bacterium]
MTPSLPPVTARDRELLDRLSQHEPLSTSELHLLFFTGLRTCRRRLSRLEDAGLLVRVFPTRSTRGGSAEALWFLSPNGRRAIGAPARRLPGLSIPDLEHRRAAAAFFLALIERSLARPDEGLYSWLGEQQAQEGTGASVRPDGYGRYLLPEGEITFYLELDRGSEPAGQIKSKLDAYRQALAVDPRREQGNILLVCQGPRRLANLARCAPPGPPWVWGTVEGERYTLLPSRDQQRAFCELPAGPRQPDRRAADCLGRRWRWRTECAAGAGGVLGEPGRGESCAAHALRGVSEF